MLCTLPPLRLFTLGSNHNLCDINDKGTARLPAGKGRAEKLLKSGHKNPISACLPGVPAVLHCGAAKDVLSKILSALAASKPSRR